MKNIKPFQNFLELDEDENRRSYGVYNRPHIVTEEPIKPKDKEKIIKYFDTMFGESYNLTKVASYPNLQEFCDENSFTKKFVIDTIREHISK